MTRTRKSVRAFALAFVMCVLLAGSSLAYADETDSSANNTQSAAATQSEGVNAAATSGESNDSQASGAVTSGAVAGDTSATTPAATGTSDGNDASGASSDSTGATGTDTGAGTDAGTGTDGAATDASGDTGTTTGTDTTQDSTQTTDPAATGDSTNTTTGETTTPAAKTDAATGTTTTTTTTTTTKTTVTKPQGVIADGTYVINLYKDLNLVLQVEKSSKKKSAYVQMKKDSNAKSQQWVFTWVDKYKAYTIKNANSGYYLTAKTTKAGKKKIIQSKYSNSTKQLWVLKKSGNGFTIVSRAKSSVGLGTWSSKAKDGYYITTQTKSKNKFKFYILPVDESLKKPSSTIAGELDGKFVKLNLKSDTSKSVTIEGEAVDAGATALLQSKKNSQSQKWYLDCVDASKGLYRIINVGSGKALQASSSKRHVNTDVNQGNPSSSQLQQWWITKNSDGSYQFTNRFNGLSLNTMTATSGSNVSLYYKPSTKTRYFQLQDVTAVTAGTKEILLAGTTTQALTVSGSSATKNLQLISKKYNSELGQKFSLSVAANGAYQIMALCSNLMLADSGSKLIQEVKADSDNQLWKLVWQRTTFSLRNMATGAYLSVANAAKDNTKVTTSSTYSAASRVLFVDKHIIDNGSYYITYGKGSSTVLGIAAKNASKSKATLNSYKKADSQNLKFTFAYLSTDSKGREVYRILNAESDMALTNTGSSLYQLKWANNNSQKWTLSLAADGGMAFVNVSTGKAISNANSTKSTVAYNMDSTDSTAVASAANRWGLTPTVAFNSYQKKAYNKVLKNYSKTNYAIMIDLKNHRLMVFSRQNKSAAWTLKYDWACSCGKKSTPTPVMNVLSTGYKRKSSPSVTTSGLEHNSSFYYMTYISKGKYIHTPTYQKGSHTKYKDKRLGKSISLGCVRVADNNAIWVYKNIKKGTRIMTYNN